MTLYRTYRPSSFDEVIGNEETIEALQSCLSKDDRPHSYLIHGPAGCGKTTIGRIIASELGCKGTDYVELDSADFRGIETVRSIRRHIPYLPLESDCRVWLLDECHQFSNDAQNALLKALEEPPSHVYFILCTTLPQKLLPTIRSRCSDHAVTTLTDTQMKYLLRHVVKAEGGSMAKAVYDQIVQDSIGHPRRALTILQQVLGLPKDRQEAVARRIAAEQSQVLDLCRALIQQAAWKKVRTILAGLQEEDPEAIRRQVLGYCKAILLKEKNDTAAAVMEAFMDPFYNNPGPSLVYACYSVAVE